MASLETFEATLKEVVQAKRLSASKMNKLTEIALQHIESDTQLVSILYRTHKSLQPAAKVHSLYAFDALSRAARSQATKQGLTADISSEKGNAATFLLKVEGVLEGLFQDMISSRSPESKEKSQKILDIWTKSNTFPSAVLARLTEVMRETGKEHPKEKSRTPTTVETPVSTITAIVPPAFSQVDGPSTSPTVDSVQSTLLALLTQAASAPSNASNGQIIANIAPPQLDSNQLALLQQLAQTAQLTGAPSQGLASSSSSATQPVFLQQPSFPAEADKDASRPSIPRWDERYESERNESRYSRSNHAPRRERDDHYEGRPRGGFRGGFRGRGRGEGRGRWDDRDRPRDGHFSPSRSRRSRSRSPRRYEARRDVKPYSPPRRLSLLTQPPDPAVASKESEMDEFGRDIRPQSSGVVKSVADPRLQPRQTTAASPSPLSSVSSNNQNALSKQIPSVAANTLSTSIDASTAGTTLSSSDAGLDKFNIATFDFTAPSSWEALGNMWHVTYGCMPSEPELLQFVMSCSSAGVASGSSKAVTSDSSEWPESNWTNSQSAAGSEPRRGGYRARGRGGRGNSHSNGNGRDAQGYAGVADRTTAGANHYAGEATDNGEVSTDVQTSGFSKFESAVSTDGHSSGTGGMAGRMQRVGDKWVFVRQPASEAT